VATSFLKPLTSSKNLFRNAMAPHGIVPRIPLEKKDKDLF